VQIAAELAGLVPEFGLVVLVLRAVRTVTGGRIVFGGTGGTGGRRVSGVILAQVRIWEMGGIDARNGPDCLGMSGNLTLLTNIFLGIHRRQVRAVSTAYQRTGQIVRAKLLYAGRGC
jgi:hypothetical protein